MDVFIDAHFERDFQRHPLVLVDVGARGGLKRNWAAARRHLRVIGFEPDPAEYRRLVESTQTAGRSDEFVNVALHNRRGPILLHVTRDRGLSSIFAPDRRFLDEFPQADRFDTVDTREVDADTLDSVLQARAIDDVDFIKADTQGSELFVLQGASETLATSVLGVEVEAEFTRIYAGQPLFADVDSFLRGAGFMLFDLRPCYWKREAGWNVGGPWGQIMWADALYLRSIPALSDVIRRLPADIGRSKALRAISVALLYGYYDYALEIARASFDVLPASDRAIIDARLRDRGTPPDRLPNFPGRHLAAAAARRFWEALRDRRYGWSVSARKFGNPR